MTLSSSCNEVFELRRKLWQNRYRPVAVYSNNAKVNDAGKRPKGSRWGKRARLNPPEASTAKPTANAISTGVLCDELAPLDIDVDDYGLADEIERIAKEMFGNAPVRRRANSARRLLLYRAAEGAPSKRSIKGPKGKIEVLGRGNQFVAFGTHPSGEKYLWPQGGPETFPQHTLTQVTVEAVQAFLCVVANLIGSEQPNRPATSSAASYACPDPSLVTARDRKYAENALKMEVAKLAAKREGSHRNDALNIAAHSLGTLVGNGSLEAETVAFALFEVMIFNKWTIGRGNSEDAAQATIESGLNAGILKPRILKSQEDPDIEMSDMHINNIAEPAREWPASLNGDAYIGIAGDFIRLVAPHTEGDPCALLIAVLTAVGSILGRTAHLPVGPTLHYGNLFSVIVAETSKGRKGTIMAEVKRFARMTDPTISARMFGGLSSGEGLIEAVRDARRGIDGRGKEFFDEGVEDKRLLVTESEMGQAHDACFIIDPALFQNRDA